MHQKCLHRQDLNKFVQGLNSTQRAERHIEQPCCSHIDVNIAVLSSPNVRYIVYTCVQSETCEELNLQTSLTEALRILHKAESNHHCLLSKPHLIITYYLTASDFIHTS